MYPLHKELRELQRSASPEVRSLHLWVKGRGSFCNVWRLLGASGVSLQFWNPRAFHHSNAPAPVFAFRCFMIAEICWLCFPWASMLGVAEGSEYFVTP
eukprot:s311_g2.t1